VRLCDPAGGTAVELTRGDQWNAFPEWLHRRLAAVGQLARTEVIRDPGGPEPCRGVVIPIGVNAEGGLVAAACGRPDFPTEADQLLLSVAANHAATAFQGARVQQELRQARSWLEKKVAERTAQLRRSANYLAEAQRLSSTGSFGWNVSSGEIYWSEETFRIFQYDPSTNPTEELILQRVHPDDVALVRQTIERAREDGEDVDVECRLVMPDGAVKHVHVVASTVSDESGGIELVGAVMDVSVAKEAEERIRQDVAEKKQAEEALRQAQAELAHVSRITTLGEMAASIAHEVDQPLSGVIINANACLRFLANASPNLAEVRDGLKAIARDGRRAGDVIGRIRALARRTATEREPLDINELIGEVVAIAQGEARRTRASLRTVLAGQLPRVVGDRVQLQQVVLNLLLNGLDAMHTVVGRPRELVIRTHREATDRVRVAVQDSGSGIDPELANRLFEAFYTTKPSGMGLGLSISRTIVEQHGGRLWVVPNEGPGTTFQFIV
jgi:C4-dicarboxylate-specific signal transduction histidine kinase